MSHPTKSKSKLISRVRRLRGQLEAVERALEAEEPCGDILNQVASIRGAVSGLTAELIEDHLTSHVVDAKTDQARHEGAAELLDAIRTYLK